MSAQYPSNVEVHRWVEAQPWGHKASAARITPQMIKAWDKAHPDRPYVKAEAYHGTPTGYRYDCKCDACREAINAQSLAYQHLNKAES